MKGFGRREEPVEMCGGTTSSYDKKAPKRIKSGEMIFFSATSALGYGDAAPDGREPIAYVSAFAAPAAEGTFLYLSTGDSFRRRDGKSETWALVREDVFSSLVALVREHDLAKNNGYHSTTHGLPENFGGDVDIRYASGERISFSNNQTPVLSLRCGEAIADLFGKAMSGERIALSGNGFDATIPAGGIRIFELK